MRFMVEVKGWGIPTKYSELYQILTGIKVFEFLSSVNSAGKYFVRICKMTSFLKKWQTILKTSLSPTTMDPISFVQVRFAEAFPFADVCIAGWRERNAASRKDQQVGAAACCTWFPLGVLMLGAYCTIGYENSSTMVIDQWMHLKNINSVAIESQVMKLESLQFGVVTSFWKLVCSKFVYDAACEKRVGPMKQEQFVLYISHSFT